ncbi:MAG: flavin reductase [Rhodobacteraceae bacterium]|nr:flavin reductase [Paracoccaceae bacterium]
MPPDPSLRAAFLDAMSRAAATVCLVTTDGPAGRFGTTVSAMTSVSADGEAPSLLVCLNREGETAGALVANGVFAVNLLHAGQADVADVFARRRTAPGGDKFAASPFVPMALGLPRLEGAMASLACRLAAIHAVGTHDICVGHVVDIAAGADSESLLWVHRGYSTGPGAG